MESIWTGAALPRFSPLRGEKRAEALVIGGGITGLLAAYFLKRKGASPVVIEAGRIAGGVTKRTTAKITSQHNLIYDQLRKSVGREKALQYARANEQAIAVYAQLIEDERIDCDFERISTGLYATLNTDRLEAEYRAAQALGLPARLDDQAPLPFRTRGILVFENQAQFHPLKFLAHIAKDLEIYEETQALSLEGGWVATAQGRIYADQIIIATHFPFLNAPGYYFARMHQERSYVVAYENAALPDGAYLGIDGGRYSIRRAGDYVLFGGGGHRTGENETGGKYDALLRAGGEYYTGARTVCRWSAQDCVTQNGIPYIGRFSASKENLYVATGFRKWGMTSAMVSAMRLSDLLSGKRPDYDVFDPLRHGAAASVPGFCADAAKSAAGLIKQNFQIPTEKLEDIPPGQAGIIETSRGKTGVYKDETGEIHTVSAKCPHLGCQLTWNGDECSWDCPCHGSRFDIRGNLLNGPAQRRN